MKINKEYLNNMFSKIKYINDELRKISEEEKRDDKALIEDALDFHITSMTLSHIVYRFYIDDNQKDEYSLGQVLLLRSLIESIALKIHVKQNKDKLLKEVFKYQYFIFEYNIYKKFKELDKKMFNLDNMNYNRKTAREHIVKNKGDSSFKLNEVFNNKVPFINEKVTYNEIILNNLGDSYLMAYKELSLLIHPHNYAFDQGMIELFKDISELLLNLIDSEYKVTALTKEDLFYFDKVLVKNNPFTLEFLKDIDKQGKLIYQILKPLDDNNFFGASNFIYKFKGVMKEVAYDMIFGLNEVISIKLKCFIELLAIFDLMLFEKDHYTLYTRMIIHTEYQSKNNRGTLADEYIKILYDTYNDTLSVKLTFTDFQHKMVKTLGFLDEDTSITKFVERFINKYKFFEIPYNGLKGKTHLLENDIYVHLKYLESQIMSHANGYLYFVNEGAWGDGINFIYILDKYLFEMLNRFKNENSVIHDEVVLFLFEFKLLVDKKIKHMEMFIKNQKGI